MKRVLLLGLAIAMCASLSVAQPGTIGLFSDALGTDCTLNSPTLTAVHFWHHEILPPGATLAQFRVVPGGGADVAEVGGFGDLPGSLHLGTTLYGIQIAYGACKQNQYYMGSQFYQFIAAPACSGLYVVEAPFIVSRQIETRDCTPGANVVLPYQEGYGLTLNPDSSCQPSAGCLPIATSEKTWGQIKALYQ